MPVSLYLLAAYLIGSLPLIHMLARRQGVSLREVGTGNVGGGNLWQQVGIRAGMIGIAGDVTKGIVAPSLGLLLSMGPWVVGMSVVAVTVGQMWPIFLGFRGGRGNAVGLAALVMLAPGATLTGMVPLGIGALLRFRLLASHPGLAKWEKLRMRGPMSKSVPLGMLGTFSSIPLIATVVQQPIPIVGTSAIILLCILFRRVTVEARGDWIKPNRLHTIKIRFLYDRG